MNIVQQIRLTDSFEVHGGKTLRVSTFNLKLLQTSACYEASSLYGLNRYNEWHTLIGDNRPIGYRVNIKSKLLLQNKLHYIS